MYALFAKIISYANNAILKIRILIKYGKLTLKIQANKRNLFLKMFNVTNA
jgi:hypothetical protein